MGLPELRVAIADALLYGGEVLELTRVALESLDLEVDGLRDVHDHLRRIPPHHVHFLDLVWLEPLFHQFGEGHVVAGEGIDAVERDARRRAMVAMGGAEILGAMGVLADDQVRTMTSDGPRDRHARLAGIFQLAVGEAEELHQVYPEHTGGVLL